MLDSQIGQRRAILKATAPQSSLKRRRIIDGAKVLLSIAKVSAAVFPSLGSCLGAIDMFGERHTPHGGFEENIMSLVPWLVKLENALATASPDTNPEEATGRERFMRSLEGIWGRAQMLSQKGKLARYLDRAPDSDAIIKLAEDLRQAIIIYQLSRQQAISTQVSQLTSSLNEFLNSQVVGQCTSVREQLQSALSWLSGLKVEGGAIEDEDEPKRRRALFDALEGIKDQFQSLSERYRQPSFQEHDESTQALSGLAEDIRDAVAEYQLYQEFDQYFQSLALNGYRRTHGAGYQHGDRNGCLKGTRESVLYKILQWTVDFERSPIFWLHGLSGTGKSTIAQSIAEGLSAQSRLGATFFCSGLSDGRSDLRLIFPTLAFQLAQRYPKFRTAIIDLLRSNPDIAYQSLQGQMEQFLVKPLQSADVSTVIIIDALDECKDEDPESTIFHVLEKSIRDIPRVKFFITSRRETHTVTGLHTPLQGPTDVFIFHEVEPRTIDQGIRRFFEYKLSKLAQRRGSDEGWPAGERLDQLCRGGAGSFVYAAAVVNFLNHLEDPWGQLDTIMGSPGSTASKGGVGVEMYNRLDALYASILRTSLQREAKDDNTIRSVLSCVVLAKRPLSPSEIATLTGLHFHTVQYILDRIQSLLVLSWDPSEPVRPFHNSFPDFMTDQTRCADLQFYISPDCHIELFTHCLELMGKPLENVPSLPDHDHIGSLDDLPEIERMNICGALQYACGSWHRHLVVAENPTQDVLSTLLGLLEEKFVFWLAVLKALGDLPVVIRAMGTTTQWLMKIQPSTNASALLETALRRMCLAIDLVHGGRRLQT